MRKVLIGHVGGAFSTNSGMAAAYGHTGLAVLFLFLGITITYAALIID